MDLPIWRFSFLFNTSPQWENLLQFLQRIIHFSPKENSPPYVSKSLQHSHGTSSVQLQGSQVQSGFIHSTLLQSIPTILFYLPYFFFLRNCFCNARGNFFWAAVKPLVFFFFNDTFFLVFAFLWTIILTP